MSGKTTAAVMGILLASASLLPVAQAAESACKDPNARVVHVNNPKLQYYGIMAVCVEKAAAPVKVPRFPPK